MILKKLIVYKKKANSIKKSLINNRNYVESGNYILGGHLRYAYKDDPTTIDFMKRVLLKNNRGLEERKTLKGIIKKMFEPRSILFKRDEITRKFEGTVYLFSNDTNIQKDVKIFNIKKGQILSVYVKMETLKQKIEDYKFFSSYFTIPKIISYDFDEKISIEELVISRPKKTWDNQDYDIVIESIFNSYKNYFDICRMNNLFSYGNISGMISQLKNDKVLNGLTIKIEKEISQNLITDKIPVINQHGDLWLYNTMLGENQEVYFIDWEHSGEYFLFYDLFWWMQNEALYNDNFSYLERYIMGKYDIHFKGIFESLNYNFNEQLRKDYVYIFILELLYKRILNNSENTKKTANTLFSKLFVQIQEVKCL